MSHPATTIFGHAELVSASISRPAQVWMSEGDLAPRLRAIASTAREEEWTLKQVQGDGVWNGIGGGCESCFNPT